MAKKPKEEIATSDVSVSLQKITVLKEEIDTMSSQALNIKVSDSTTLSVAENNLSQINDIVKLVESKRKEVKDPYLQACKTIDETCKTLVESAQKSIAYLKEEIKTYEIKRQEEQRKKEAELEKKKQEELEKLEKERAEKESQYKYIHETLSPWLQKQYSAIDSPEKGTKLLSTIEEKWPDDTKVGFYKEDAANLKASYVQLISSKITQLSDAGNISEAQANIIKQREELIKQKEELAAKEKAIKALEEAEEAERKKKELEAQLAKEKKKLEEEKSAKTRKTWKFELVDKSKLIPDWIAIDEDVVKSYLRDNKESIKDGEVINGIKFYQEISVSA